MVLTSSKTDAQVMLSPAIAPAKAKLGWEAQFGIEEMCRDSWNFLKNNPNGYEK